jgi:phenylacetate-CoA ligase
MRPRLLNFLHNFYALKKEQWLDCESLGTLQKERLGRIISEARATPRYSKMARHEDPYEALSSVPVTAKQDVQKDASSFMRPGTDLKSLQSIKTSGSTGTPLELFIDREALDWRAAMKYFVETEFGLKPFDLFAEVSVGRHDPHPLLSLSGLFRRIPLSVFDPEEENFSRILRSRPSALGWYPSSITIFARLNEDAGRLLKLKRVFCGSEMLSPAARKSIGDSFSCGVFNHYGAVEFSTIAWECPEEHSLHVNSNSCLVEILDERGNPKRSGAGNIVITCLHNRAMPILRYSIGDRGSWGKECPCGRGLPVLGSLEGRTNDMIILPSGKLRNPVALDIFYGIPGIMRYQIVQEKEDLFTFRFVPSGRLPESSRKEILRRMDAGCLGEKVSVEFEEAASIERGRGGKLSTVVSLVRRRFK